MHNTVQLLRALADPTRLRILNLLARGELCVCEITKILEIGQSKASRHLAYLKNAGLVTDRREGLWMHYALATPSGVLHGQVLDWLVTADAEIPHAGHDLRALDDLRRRGELCAQASPGEGAQAACVATEATP